MPDLFLSAASLETKSSHNRDLLKTMPESAVYARRASRSTRLTRSSFRDCARNCWSATENFRFPYIGNLRPRRYQSRRSSHSSAWRKTCNCGSRKPRGCCDRRSARRVARRCGFHSFSNSCFGVARRVSCRHRRASVRAPSPPRRC